jgi:hypothetical protein
MALAHTMRSTTNQSPSFPVKPCRRLTVVGLALAVVAGILVSATAASAAPPATTLISPSGTISTTMPTYTWNTVSEATWYYLWVNDPSGTPVIQTWYTSSAASCGSTTCSVTPAVTVSAGMYTWWVQTWNSTGFGPWSTGLTFTTPTAPTMTTLLSPANGYDVPTTVPTYSWNKVATSTWYYLWVQNAAGTRVILTWYASDAVCGDSVCSVTPSVRLSSGIVHTWWVQTWNPAGSGPWSSPFSFTPRDTMPGAATLFNPLNMATVSSPGVSIQWLKVTEATDYFVWLDNASTGAVLRQWYTGASVCGSSLCSLAIPVNLPSGHYNWWIQTWSPAGYGPWSTGFTFTVASAPTSIVLTTRESPSDVDAHLLTPPISGVSYDVWDQTPGDAAAPPYALLDDNHSGSLGYGFGVEVIGVAQRFPGTYRYYVHNYSGTPPLAGSSLRVSVYASDTLVTTLMAPATGTGSYWHVCDVDGATGTVSCPNTITTVPPTSAAAP